MYTHIYPDAAARDAQLPINTLRWKRHWGDVGFGPTTTFDIGPERFSIRFSQGRVLKVLKVVQNNS